ncbi:MAG: PAS domain-containing protein [Alphaproteobacteria bacterium]|nr:PAS domain-containing protein [Alphaproteobacteria bacterium]
MVLSQADRQRITSAVRAALAGNERALQPLAPWAASACQVRINPPPTAIAEPLLVFLLQHWSTMARGKALPLARAIDPMDIRPALGQVVLLDVTDDGWDGRYRVFGTLLAERFGAELTGKRMSRGLPAASLPLHIALLRMMLESGSPVWSRHPAPPEIAVADWTRLMLPLEDGNGTITRCLVGSLPGEWRTPRSAP